MKVRYTATARIEIDEILAHVAADNPPAAAAVGTAIKLAVARLRSFPHLGTATDEPTVHIQIASPYRYLIFYAVLGETIVIRNVRHPARRRPRSNRA